MNFVDENFASEEAQLGLRRNRDLRVRLLELYLLFVGLVMVAALIFALVAHNQLEADAVASDLSLAQAIASQTDGAESGNDRLYDWLAIVATDRAVMITIVDKQKTIQTRQMGELDMPDDFAWQEWQERNIASALRRTSGSLITTDPAGRDWLFSFATAPISGQKILVQQPTTVAFASLAGLNRGLLIALGVFVVGGALFWFLLSHLVITPLDQFELFSSLVRWRGLIRAEEQQDMDNLAQRKDQVGSLAQSLLAMEQDIEARFVQLSTLLETSRIVAASLDAEQVINNILEQVRLLFHIERCAVVVLDERMDVFRVRASLGISEAYVSQLSIAPSEPNSPSMRALRNQEPVQVSDTETDPSFTDIRDRSQKEGFRSILAIPLFTQHALPAVLLLYKSEPYRYSYAELQLASSFGDHASIAMENAALHALTDERLQEQMRRLEIVASLSEQLTAILDIDQLLDELVHQVTGSFGYYHAQVYIIDDKRQNLVMMAGAGKAGQKMKRSDHSISLDASASLVARAARTGEIVWIDNVREAPDWLPNELLPNTYAEMAVPIILGGQAAGVLDVQEDKIAGLDESDANLLRSLANQVAVTIHNAQLFDETVAARREAETANELKSQFLSNMSHELRTPLNAIINFSGFVLDGVVGEVNEEQAEMLQRVIDGGQHLLNLINDVLDLSRIEAGFVNLIFEEVDVNGVAKSTMAAAKGLIKDKPVELIDHIEPDLPLLVGDKRRVRQVFLNLISNAIKYTPAGQVMVEMKAEDEGIYLVVQDTGIGIDPEDRELIFESFTQARHNLDNVISTGLGLPITKQLVELHGGRIWFESEVNVGSTFHVFWPLRPIRQNNVIMLDKNMKRVSKE